jgi:tetratricopeptide (TPR) repeat protein
MLSEFYRKLEEKYAAGNPKEVEDFLLEESRRHFLCCGKTDDVQVAVYNELGSYYLNRGRITQALDQFKVARDFVATLCGSETPEYATVVNNLARAYRLADNKEKALESYKEALGVYERTVGKDSYLYASALNNVALLYIETGSFDKAKEALFTALDMMKDNDELKQEQAITLTNIATLYMFQGQNKDAMEYLKHAIGIYNALPKEQKMHLAAAYNTLGDLLVKEGKKTAAKDSYKTAKDLTARYFGKNTEYAITCKKLAMLAQSEGDTENAKAQIQEALDVLRSLGLSKKEIYTETEKLAGLMDAR